MSCFSINFNFILSSEESISQNNDLRPKWSQLIELINQMLATKYRERPTCDEVLSQFNSCDMTISDVKNCLIYDKIIDNMKCFSNQFFYNYFNHYIL